MTLKKLLPLAFAVLLAVLTSCADIQTEKGVLCVYYFNVGQGDAALAVLDGTSILFDAGTNESAEKLAAYLSRLQIEKIDCMVLSHPHEDHIGGADTVLERFKVDSVIMPLSDSLDRCYVELVNAVNDAGCTVYSAVAGDSYSFGEIALDMLAPTSITGDANLDSAIVKLVYGETSFLFTGDCEGDAEQNLINIAGDALRSDVLNVGHHGSNTASSDEFLDAVAPKIAVISCAEGNDYGHPHPDVLKRLAERDIWVERTDLGKSITVTSDGKTVSVKD